MLLLGWILKLWSYDDPWYNKQHCHTFVLFIWADKALRSLLMTVQGYQDFQNGNLNYRLDHKRAIVGAERAIIEEVSIKFHFKRWAWTFFHCLSFIFIVYVGVHTNFVWVIYMYRCHLTVGQFMAKVCVLNYLHSFQGIPMIHTLEHHEM